jgi:phosphodiesterase/alkaline phosphatase D-like protein
LDLLVFSQIKEGAVGDQAVFDGDAWDGYHANRNRTFQTLYDNDIGNNIMLSGDSHAVNHYSAPRLDCETDRILSRVG